MITAWGGALRRSLGDLSVMVNNLLGRYHLRHFHAVVNDSDPAAFLAVLMYHGLESNSDKLAHRPLDVHPTQCEKEIEFYIQQGYKICSPRDLENAEPGKSYLVVSFDDGHHNIAQHLKQWMAEKGWPFTLSLCPEIMQGQKPFWWEEAAARFDLAQQVLLQVHGESTAIEINNLDDFVRLALQMKNSNRLMMMEQLREATSSVTHDAIAEHPAVHRNLNIEDLQKLTVNPLITVAAHAMSHETATSLDRNELMSNAKDCKEFLESTLNCEVHDYVYPNGLFSPETDEALLQLGFKRLYSIGHSIPRQIITKGRIQRVRGYGFGAQNLRYFAHQWQQRHSATGENSTEASQPFY